jgi:iron(III) transport system ATP-binding protein
MNTATSHETGGASLPPYLHIESVSKRYGKVTVVDAVDLRAPASKFVCVLGPSGCGKTTLLRLIAGFETADTGRIVQAGRDVTALPPEARDYGIVFQSYALFPNRTVAGNVSFGLEAIGVARAARETRVSELLKLVGLAEHAAKYPNQISGGQQQRVALARALALSPGLLLLDEPLSALDANVRAHLRDELKALQQRIGVTALMVTHDREEAFSVADQIVIMNKGRIEQTGSPEEIYRTPANLFVARLLGGCNALRLDVSGDSHAVAQGLKLSTGPSPTLRNGNAYACIRPGAVLVGHEAVGSENAFPARITSLTFLGDIVRLQTRPEQGTGALIEAEVLRSRFETLPAPGENIMVALPKRHLMFLEDTAVP